MPMSPQAMTGLQSGMQMASGIFGSLAAAQMAKKQRAHEISMYNQQKADYINQWHMENQYNSPAQQMQRMKDAGLNPNLMYGSPQSGGIANNISAAKMDVSDSYTNAGKSIAQNVQNMGQLDYLYNYKLQQAQIHNVEQQTKTSATQSSLNIATSALRHSEQALNQTRNATERATLQSKVQLLREQINNLAVNSIKQQNETTTESLRRSEIQNNMRIATQRNTREQLLNGATISQIWQNIKESKSRQEKWQMILR